MARNLRLLALTSGLALALALGAPHAARADEPHDKTRSGHPLRIAAYVLYPVGLLIDTILFRPAHWLVNREPLKTVFGHED